MKTIEWNDIYHKIYQKNKDKYNFMFNNINLYDFTLSRTITWNGFSNLFKVNQKVALQNALEITVEGINASVVITPAPFNGGRLPYFIELVSNDLKFLNYSGVVLTGDGSKSIFETESIAFNEQYSIILNDNDLNLFQVLKPHVISMLEEIKVDGMLNNITFFDECLKITLNKNLDTPYVSYNLCGFKTLVSSKKIKDAIIESVLEDFKKAQDISMYMAPFVK